MINQIIYVSFDFRLLYSKFDDWNLARNSEGDSLVVLRELDLTAGDACRTADRTAAAHAACAANAAYWKVFDQAGEEFAKTEKIKGFEVLNLRSLDKLWISRHDMEILTK